MAALPPVPPLPTPRLTQIKSALALLEPLSRQATGPGLVVLSAGRSSTLENELIQDAIPSSLMKWAEESYTVVELREDALGDPRATLQVAIDSLKACERCEPKHAIGLVAYDPKLWNIVSSHVSGFSQIVGAVVYGDSSSASEISPSPVPVLQHLAGKSKARLPRSAEITGHDYPDTSSYLFATPFQKQFSYSTESVSHTRNLTFLKKLMGGPNFDLEAIWDEHTYYEFENRSVEHTMATMVQEPYVNHVPTLTGGIGRKDLTDFYTNHFIFSNPESTELELISRTIGIDRIVDEFIFKLTHDSVVDWLCPGIPPTHKRLEIPFMAVVNVRGDRLYHEHIMWDQSTLLRQLDLLPEFLPFPSALQNGNTPQSGKSLEYQLPVPGLETAAKLRNRSAIPSNGMFEYKTRES